MTSSNTPLSYKDAGVDIVAGDALVERIKPLAKKTMLTAFQSFQAFNEGPDGPFTGAMTDAQRTFLEGQLATWDGVRSDVTNMAAYNGTNQKRLDTLGQDLVSRQNALAGMIGDITDADMAQAV
ncbi:MAG: hypothetical protein U1C47_14475, partial [Hydrogenophaga sp.]|nr:hypothetical protein [Hydrogenophaga sp.]